MSTSIDTERAAAAGERWTPVAVIDVGTTSIRMAIAEISEAGEVRTLDTLSQGVSIGKDTFTQGVITKPTIEECVDALISYRRVLQEYGIVLPDRIRVVATSAVREAQNRLAFVDRIYSATGFDVDPIDEAEVNRVTYLGVQPYLKAEPASAGEKTLIIEIGGGSTEVLLVQGEDVIYSHSYRLGSLRLRETLESFRAPTARRRTVMANQIDRTVAEIVSHVPTDAPAQMIALGGDVRFAASQLVPEWDPGTIGRIPVDRFAELTDRFALLTEDEIVQRYHLAYPEAETLFPALLAYLQLARALEQGEILITNVNLRDGLLKEMAVRGAWTDDFCNQIIRAAIDLGRKFDFDEAHARYVADVCRTLFDDLQDVHQLDPRFRVLLTVSALLHEIGHFISNTGHHKHSMYLIQNSELFGIGHKDLLLIALVARYHRRASPKPTHTGYATLDREHRIAVAKMSALLRVADSLDRSHSQRIRELVCERENGRLVVFTPHVEDLSLEQLALKQKGSLFEEIFGMDVLLRPAK